MDRRRFQLAHLKYAILKVVGWYPDHLHLSAMPMTADAKATLEMITPVFYTAFRTNYAGMLFVHVEHTCKYHPCIHVLN